MAYTSRTYSGTLIARAQSECIHAALIDNSDRMLPLMMFLVEFREQRKKQKALGQVEYGKYAIRYRRRS